MTDSSADPRDESPQAGPPPVGGHPPPGGDSPPGVGSSGHAQPPGDPPQRGDRTTGRLPEPGFERLDPRVVPYWLVSGALGVAVLGAVAAAVLFVFREPLGSAWRPVLWLGGTAFGALLLWQLIAPPLAWRRWRYAIDDELLTARYGIVFHEEKAIPVSRLQHVDLTRGPVERMFGLATLVVHTAGTEAASFRLPGLDAAVCRELRDRILEARGDDVV